MVLLAYWISLLLFILFISSITLRILLLSLYVGITVFGAYMYITKTVGNYTLASTVAFIIMSNAPVIYSLSVNSSKLVYGNWLPSHDKYINESGSSGKLANWLP